MNSSPPLPPFTGETARQKVQAAEDAWNTRNPERNPLGYMQSRYASINDQPITEAERKFRWDRKS